MQHKIMDLVVEAGRTLLENGAEVSRVQQTMEIMADSLHLNQFNVYVLTNGIFATAEDGRQFARIRNVPTQDIHLGRVAAVNELSRQIAAGRIGVEAASEELARIREMPYPPKIVCVLACAMGSAAFAIMFGGGALEAAAGFAAGILLQLFLLWVGSKHLNKIATKVSGAAVLAVIALAETALLPGLLMDKVIIGALMTMTPGVALTTSIRDFVNGDYLSGTIRMIDALLVAGALACGVGLILSISHAAGGAAL